MDLMDQSLNFSVAMGPLRKKMATGGTGTTAASEADKPAEDTSTKNESDGEHGNQTGEVS